MINKKVILLFTHTIVLIMGFALGVYFLPILTAPKSLDVSTINEYEQKATYQTEFVKELKGSDFLHWGEAKSLIYKIHHTFFKVTHKDFAKVHYQGVILHVTLTVFFVLLPYLLLRFLFLN